MKVLWHGNAPWLPTGYGNQTALVAPRIAALGHEVAISAFCGIQATTSNWGGIPVFPGGLEAYGNDILPGHAKTFGADLVLTLMDAWVLHPEMARSLNMACWMPVDCTPLSAMDRQFLRESKVTPIAMSEHGVRELETAGFSSFYAPHAIDTSVYAPGDKAAAREALGVPQDAFAIGLNMANIDAVRKGFPEQMSAFAMFRKKHPEALLLMHSHQTGPGTGMNLGDIITRLGIGDAMQVDQPLPVHLRRVLPAGDGPLVRLPGPVLGMHVRGRVRAAAAGSRELRHSLGGDGFLRDAASGRAARPAGLGRAVLEPAGTGRSGRSPA